MKKYDLFLFYVSEDKDEIVRLLVEYLKVKGYFVWFDEMILKFGDLFCCNIDVGFVNFGYGVVIFSKNFFNKRWF